MSFQYKIYGLRITSSRRINLLSEQKNSTTDLSVSWTTDKSETPDSIIEWNRISTDEINQRNGISLWESETPSGFFTKLRFNTEFYYIDFLLDDSKKNLWVIHDEKELEDDLNSLFVGPVLGCILRLCGIVCLHASVVNIDARAVVITGAKRGGKSTTAAGFSQLGYQVLADDVAVVTSQDGCCFVQPGYPKVRIRPDPLAALFHEVEATSLPLVYSDGYTDSRYFSLKMESDFCAESLPLGAIYILGERNEAYIMPYIEPIEAHEKLIKLTQNTFGSYVVYKSLRIEEFKFLAELARKTPIRQLMFGNDLRTLSVQCQTIIEDFRRLTG